MDEQTLEPCPFCGADAEMQPWHGGGPDKQLVGCSEHAYECPVGPSVTGETPAEAITAWNRRAAHSVIAVKVAELAERAFREGFQHARECLGDDDAYTLTVDVEEDCWLDSKTRRAALAPHPERRSEHHE